LLNKGDTLLIVTGEFVLEVTHALLDVTLALVHGPLGLLAAVPGETTNALFDAALGLVAETLRAVLRAVVIRHDIRSFETWRTAKRLHATVPASVPDAYRL